MFRCLLFLLLFTAISSRAQDTFMETFLYDSFWPGATVAYDSIAFSADTTEGAPLTRAIRVQRFPDGSIDSIHIYYRKELSEVYDGQPKRQGTAELRHYSLHRNFEQPSLKGMYTIEEKDSHTRHLKYLHNNGGRFSTEYTLLLTYTPTGHLSRIFFTGEEEMLPEPVEIMQYFYSGNRLDSAKTTGLALDMDLRLNMRNVYKDEKLVLTEMDSYDGGVTHSRLTFNYNDKGKIRRVLHYMYDSMDEEWELYECWRYLKS